MQGHQKPHWLLVFAFIGMVSPTVSWGADKPANSGSIVPVSSATTVRTVDVVPTGFTSANEVRNTIVDNMEDVPMMGPRYPIPCPSRTRLGRSLQQTEQRIRYNEDKMVRWFWFIRGHGPANWEFP